MNRAGTCSQRPGVVLVYLLDSARVISQMDYPLDSYFSYSVDGYNQPTSEFINKVDLFQITYGV
nr:hypothetical protein SYMBAF_210017 [Serratia symbiotica]